MAMWLLTLTSAAPTPLSSSVPLYGQYEITLTGPSEAAVANPFEVELSATFTHTEPPTGTPIVVGGFYDGGGTYRVRFSPPAEGEWKYTTASSASALDGSSGEFHVVKKAAGDRGPVVSKGSGLYYADFTPHVSVGTTCYQWASKGFDMQAQTLETLKASPFNKIRMTTFPKWYIFNRANPVETGAPYEIAPGSAAANASAWACVGEHCPSLSGSFDLKRFNVSFWQNYDRLVGALKAQGVIADIILFHPYDGGHWGFDCMGGRDAARYDTASDKFYLRYAAARLAAYSNVWWCFLRLGLGLGSGLGLGLPRRLLQRVVVLPSAPPLDPLSPATSAPASSISRAWRAPLTTGGAPACTCHQEHG